jgi:hypothetical protein
VWTDADIASMRAALRHAADHLSEVREEAADPYHAGESAPVGVSLQLCPLLNAIESYAQEIRHALVTMATGGLLDDGQGHWYLGDAGPYDTLEEALTARGDDLSELAIQDHEHDEDD